MKFMDRVLGYCLWSVVEFSFANLLHKESRRKFVNTYQSRLRKIFNYLLDTKDDECYQQLQAYDGEGVTTPSWNLKGKSYLSENKKKLIDDLNRYIQTGIHPLIIIDKYYIFSQDV